MVNTLFVLYAVLTSFAVAKRGDAGEWRVSFKGRPFEEVTFATRHEDVVLECEAGGSPSPTIHWLKNGERIQQVYLFFFFFSFVLCYCKNSSLVCIITISKTTQSFRHKCKSWQLEMVTFQSHEDNDNCQSSSVL